MLSDEAGTRLHDMATRGKPLTSDEHDLLEKWYEQQDKAESESLNSYTELQTDHILQKQIDSVLIRIGTATEQISYDKKYNRSNL